MASKIRPEINLEVAGQSFRIPASFAVICRTVDKFGKDLPEVYRSLGDFGFESCARFIYAVFCANDEKGKSPLTVSEIGDHLVSIGYAASLNIVVETLNAMTGGAKDEVIAPEKK